MRDRRAAGPAPLRRRQPRRAIDSPAWSTSSPNDALDVQRLGRRRQGQLRRQLFRAAGVDLPHAVALRPTTASRTASAAARSYNYERYFGLQRSRSASPGPGERSAARLDHRLGGDRQLLLDLRHAAQIRTQHRSTLVVRLQPRRGRATSTASFRAGRCRRPRSFPKVFNKLQQLHLDVRHRLSNRLAATFSYLYEPFRVYDFAFDPSVVNSIVQPSSLVLGYVYRPYTAHSADHWLEVLCRRSSARSRPGGFHERQSGLKDLLTIAIIFVALMAMSRPAAAQERSEEGTGGLHRPEVFGLPLHRRQGRQGKSARRRRREAFSRRNPAVDHPPERDGGEGEVHEEAAHAGQVRQAAGGRHRCAGRVHAEPEVGDSWPSLERSPVTRSRSPARCSRRCQLCCSSRW